MSKTPILIAGPTASGKSHLALALATRVGGALINADSMQIYDGLRVLTARPSEDELSQAPHLLYGVLDAATRCSVGLWGRMAAGALTEVAAKGLTPIFAGGTGLYFRALTEGLSAIPEIPEHVRGAALARLEQHGIAGLLAEVTAKDPATASQLRPGDSQRIQRAWEVLEATGKGLAAWQATAGEPVLAGPTVRMVLTPPRPWLYGRCEARFDHMLEAGALDEVAALMERNLDASLPAMKALGVRELAALSRGEISKEAALEDAKKLTRRYAKRQLTWMRNQLGDWPQLDPSRDEALAQAIAIVKSASR